MNKPQSIQEIQALLREIDHSDDPFIELCKKDERKGVQKALEQWRKKQQKKQLLQSKWTEMNRYERDGRTKGFQAIAGIDEVGRGPLAGPVVAAAVVLPEDFVLLGLDDSKKITEKNRELYYGHIIDSGADIGIGIIESGVIDEINIYEASKKAMLEAINGLKHTPDYLLIDAMKLPVGLPQESIIKGDAKSVSISAASIIAKVTRDHLMCEYDTTYPEYGFRNNMGYGTKEHLSALDQFGITPIHRKSFAPVKDIVGALRRQER
ncbi:ribonuclease HII [Bacillus sp. 1P06AnD]|uniref:ribonuclease HII n=1 Tax=Bacillus sp. 1P06AnD TaxID=3132208 RepID=UPI0039A359E9